MGELKSPWLLVDGLRFLTIGRGTTSSISTEEIDDAIFAVVVGTRAGAVDSMLKVPHDSISIPEQQQVRLQTFAVVV